MKFKDYKYSRPDVEKFEDDFRGALKLFREANSSENQINALKMINKLRNSFETQMELIMIRHSIDTTDEFYEEENNFSDEVMPSFEGLINEYYHELVNAKYRKELEKEFGEHIFNLADMVLKTFSPDILEDLKLENKLSSEYVKLRAAAKIDFEGEERNISQMQVFLESKDRDIRKRASREVSEFFKQNEAEFDRIFDELVHVRDKMARKLGFKNYIELGYNKLMRSDYDYKMVSNYRKQIYNSIVPFATKLRDRQAKRLNLDKLYYYDEGLQFLSGNANPHGDSDWIIDNGRKMYKELSHETDEFFKFMMDRELMDVLAKKGKAGGGYCTYISDYKSPFIFSNFNGTSGDIDVLTHEAGHAFQVYSSRDYELPEYIWPTLEACEIHSMSMEFFTWNWMGLFFKDDVEKYKFTHLSDAVLFIPYGAAVDEFQHFVYENPNVSVDERKSKWRELERKYLPHREYDEDDFLDRGGYWFRQGHIFMNPFYYIDYTLAQVCAFEFWHKSNRDMKSAWNDYLKLCKMGGSKPFLELLKVANLHNPFRDGSIDEIIKPVKEYLQGVDDLSL